MRLFCRKYVHLQHFYSDMMTTDKINSLVQLKAFSRIDGAWMALFWLISFTCFVLEFRYPVLSMAWLITLCAIPVAAALQLKRFRDRQTCGVMSFRKGWAYITYTFFYATILFALAQYVYFAFIDQGYLVGQYVSALSDPVYKAAFQAYGYSQADLKTFINQLYELKPIGLAMNFATVNLITGMILAIPLAAILRNGGNRTDNTNK